MRHVLHTVVSLLMWCLFGYYWWVVGQRRINPSTIDALAILGVFAVVGFVLTVAWVAHNLRLARKFGRRKGFPAPPESFTTDHLQRPLVSPGIEALRAARLVTISLDAEGRKIYEPGGEVAD
ncbi:MAG TPA: hypothetical protein PLQ13_09235 [Candidatus Krumholzibacteria bacterium]|nr:hypothetical protein [Candidatus Krumholzibacteria bacterium]